MAERHEEKSEMLWLEMDVLDLQFNEDEFDVVIDKGNCALDIAARMIN